MCESAYQGNVTEVDGSGRERRTLAEVSLYLDSITVDGYFLTWDQGTLVAGLLGHIELCCCVCCVYSAETTASELPSFVISRGIHVASRSRMRYRPEIAPTLQRQ